MAEETTTTAPPPSTAAPAPAASGAPPIQSVDDVYGEFDALEASAPPAPKKEAAALPTKSSEKEETKPQTVPKVVEQPKPTTKGESETTDGKSVGEDTIRPVKAPELRAAYENLKKEHRTLKAELEQVRTKSADTTQVKQLTEALEAERKARADLEQEFKTVAYSKSEEYKEKYQKPMHKAYQMGRLKAASLSVTDDLGEERQGTEGDFDTIMRTESDQEAIAKATELFGQVGATLVLQWRERVKELHSHAQEAIEEHKSKIGTIEKEQALQRTQAEQQQAEAFKARTELFHKSVEEGKKARAELFEVAEGDEEAKAAVTRGEEVADSLFSGINPKTGKPYSPEGLVKFHAFVRNAVAAHGNLLHKLKTMQTRMTELESDLAEFKGSSTSADAGRGGESRPTSDLPGDEEFDAADRGRR